MTLANVTPEMLEAHLHERAIQFHPALPGRKNDVQTGVLVPLIWGDDVQIVLTERSHAMPHAPGEICLPGGKAEPHDADLEATAKREAREEIGVTDVRTLGRLSSYPMAKTDYRLEPTVALVQEAQLKTNPREVAGILRLSVLDTLRLPHLEVVVWEDGNQSWDLPAVEVGGAIAFSATALVVLELLQCFADLAGVSLPPPSTSRSAELLARLYAVPSGRSRS